MDSKKQNLIEVKNLQKYFPIKKGLFSKTVGNVKAVDDLSFNIFKGETLGLVGESGCGKTSVGRSILRLIEPSAGSIIFNGVDITNLASNKMRDLRRKMQIIFQDPYSSLNPRITIGGMLAEIIKFHKLRNTEGEINDRISELLTTVGLQPEYARRYPHEFSGGQRQRIGIARALSVEPEFIVCDEPVSALDVSIQSQVINLLDDLQDKFNLTYLFISHGLSVVQHISDRVAVMYLGKIVEIADVNDLYRNPKHPYTQALLSAAPVPDPRNKSKRIPLEGDVPSPSNVPPGCHFHPRCKDRLPECSSIVPVLADDGGGHEVKCLLFNQCRPLEISLSNIS
jgi:oligopeptide transport system ATP-binding protein